MSELDKRRESINEIDKKMAHLFEERMVEVKAIADIKMKEGLPILNKDREEALIKKNVSYISNDEIKEYYIDFLKNEIELSKEYQSLIISSIGNNVIHVKGKYDIHIGRSIIYRIKEYIDIENRKILIISDSNIPKEYIEIVRTQIKDSYVFIFEAGEKSKSIETYLSIEKFLLENNFNRHDAIIALGGGVTGDLSGFAASTYMRGIDFYNIPTSLLSMVDSSVGGKTGIDFNGVKNIVGSFFSPKAILIDPNLLSTLPIREFNAGLAEAIKMASTFNPDLFSLIENSNDIYKDIDKVIYESIKIKAKVVEIDAKEKGLRSVLNFGHTIGHAFESSSKGSLLHGEAIALGMLYFSSKDVKERLIKVLDKYNLNNPYEYDKNEILSLISHDKKSENDKIKVIKVDEIGTYKIDYLSLSEIGELL